MSSSLIRTCPGKCKKPFVKSDGCNSVRYSLFSQAEES